jgi:hypothetical protein
MVSTQESVSITRGSILIYRVFDIAEEIDLHEVDRLLMPESGESRLRLTRNVRSAVVVRHAPVRLNLGEVTLQFKDQSFRAETVATIWDYGVCSVAFQVRVLQGTSWERLIQLSALVNSDAVLGAQIDSLALQKAHELTRLLTKALKRPSEWGVSEDYVIYFFEEVQGVVKGPDLLARADLPALVLGETTDVLSERIRESLLQNVFQYAANDFVMIDWNSAVVFEPSGNREITDVLEFALTHLLELRYYDDLLDRRLTELYDSIEARRQTLWKAQFGRISREANSRYLEFSEFMERVDNSLKVVGDFYLATIFRGAVKRFRIMDWQQSIARKMNLLARVSELLLGEVNVYRGHLLEIIIILLILFEIISAMFKGL